MVIKFYREEIKIMKKFEEAQLEIVEFNVNDVITTSGCNVDYLCVGADSCPVLMSEF